MIQKPAILWFRQDLRLADNPALRAAAARGRPVLPVYILDDETIIGGAARWWLHNSLERLGRSLGKLGAPLLLKKGRAIDVLPRLADQIGAGCVLWNRCYEPHAVARDTALKAALKAQGIAAESFNAGLLFEPWEIATKSGAPYKVFTPFWKACLARGGVASPQAAPKSLTPSPKAPHGEGLDSWTLRPSDPDWAKEFGTVWTPGEAGARARLNNFLDRALEDYGAGRDRPDLEATSRLSPHLHWGEIGPRQIWQAIETRNLSDGRTRVGQAAAKFLSELGWREFSHHLLFHFPGLPEKNFNRNFDAFPWRDDARGMRAWQRGRTGYPIVDAGMRELWATGWMHNRVRMVAASFLTKHLLIDWRAGARWFWDTLVDADLANNSASWQWVAGCGADAAPYFRIFNPVLQGQKFDPKGAYVRRWVPELARLPATHIHRPWMAPIEVLRAAGIELGRTYPNPIVDHKAARARALEAYDKVRV
jgi:deoxyribodipyrimidine photo-lyase